MILSFLLFFGSEKIGYEIVFKSEFVNYILELPEPFEEFIVKSMSGGYGI